jgi:hypothetical protein
MLFYVDPILNFWGENSVRLILAAVLVLMLSSVAMAATETKQVGPYTISFNMNTDMNYGFENVSSQEGSSGVVYPLVIKSDNTTGASIAITEFKEQTDSTTLMQSALAYWKMIARGFNATIPVSMAIDGKDGFLLSGKPFPGSNAPEGYTVFQAQYWLDSKSFGPVSAGTTMVDVTSTYPQDITMDLLNSIKVEKKG